MEQGRKAFVTLASQQHAGNGCHPFADAVNTGYVRAGMACCGNTVWPFSHIRVVPAFVKLFHIHLGVLCGAFRDARRAACDVTCDTDVRQF